MRPIAKVVLLLAMVTSLAPAGCDDEGRYDSGGDGDSDSDSDSDSDADADSDADLPPQTLVLQNGTAGYGGCVDIAVPVPEDSGFDEITPEDDLIWVRHSTWTGS